MRGRLERHEGHAEAGRPHRGLAGDHGGLVHDHGGERHVERDPVAHEVALERLTAHGGRRRQQVDRLPRQARPDELEPRDRGAGQEHPPAERIESDGHAEGEEHDQPEPPGQRPDGAPHRRGAEIPEEPCDEREAGRKEQRAQ